MQQEQVQVPDGMRGGVSPPSARGSLEPTIGSNIAWAAWHASAQASLDSARRALSALTI